MRAAGIHTYMGGMQIGASRVFEDAGSAESWKPAMKARGWLGLKTHSVTDYQKVDVAYCNPPCSRFSMSANDLFDEQDKSDLSKFECLGECATYAMACGARAFWWETGPLMARTGQGIVSGVAALLGAKSHWVIQLDAQWHGVPQRRPRCHAVFFMDRDAGPEPVLPRVKAPPVREWLEGQGLTRQTPGGPDGEEMTSWGARNLQEYVEIHQIIGKRVSWHPRFLKEGAPLHPAVISRPVGFHDRWVTLEEAAALMGYPEINYSEHPTTSGPAWHQWLMLMGKGVASYVAEGVAKEIRRVLQ